ncbi:MAG: hypothetical protein HY305_00735, partial [Sphingobacteriales bacterium]|nr:hypothetical protein [Sphingobacteriales bacterium]
GGVSANAIYYDGNGQSGRQPFTWYINGNVNVNLFKVIDLPFSFNLTNAGAGYNYPSLPNRLSLHPTYKWVTAHIGDISMVYSPYTLNGYQFRGGGLDLAPPGRIKVSVMGGQFQRAVEYDSTNKIIQATYRRYGYGGKISYLRNKYTVGLTVFGAKDQVNSLKYKPDSLQIHPQENMVVSLNLAVRPMRGLELSGEYANSAITKDLRDSTKVTSANKNILKALINTRNSTSFYKAIKANLNYRYHNSVIGVGYERIDPGYETLGAYFFNNDLENITVNFSQPFFKQKGNISANFGYQRDNLDGKKSGSNNRNVAAVNLSFVPNQRFIFTAGYSNFSTFMYIKPVFQSINQLTQIQNLDTLNFSQVSQNANANINYIFIKRVATNHSVNFNFNLLNAVDKQGTGSNLSTFYNGAAAYTLAFVPKEITITAAYNVSYNTLGISDFVTQGPTLSFNSKLFKKKIGTSLISSYNTSTASGVRSSDVFNIRFSAAYLLKKQNFNISIMNQYRDVALKGSTNDLIATVGYSFYF